jgi:predicted DCC family thiol-disulfide oxidoreductase YuxK
VRQKAALEIWFDGECPLCLRSRAWCVARDPDTRLEFRDFQSVPDDELPVPREKLASAMWVRDHDGQLLGGYAGWRRILADLPRWRWFSVLAGMVPLRWLGPPAYRIVARWRHLVPVAAVPECDAHCDRLGRG